VPSRSKLGPSLALGALVVALCGCERGCLARWLEGHGAGPATGPGTPGRGPPPSGDLGGLGAIDCPDGMARCGLGIVHVSRAYHYPDPCTLSPEQCQCPWERLGDCPNGCAADGVELDVPRERALTQLCAPGPRSGDDARASFSAVPPPGTIASSCDLAYVCEKGVVVVCGPPAQAVAACTGGCAREGQGLDVDEETAPVTPAAAVALLCKR
jgi:hypothetical protein